MIIFEFIEYTYFDKSNKWDNLHSLVTKILV